MPKPASDWKYQSRHLLDWITIGVTSVLIVLYFYLGVTEGDLLFFGLAIVFLGWLLVYLTEYWSSILYLVMVGIVLITVTFWVLAGDWQRPGVTVILVLNAGLVILVLYLFSHEIR